MSKERIEFIKPDDFHVHLRQGEPLPAYAQATAASFRRALLMPNTEPPIDTAKRLQSYKEEICSCTDNFEPLMSFKLGRQSANEVEDLVNAGAVSAKLYPQGATTNSDDGVSSLKEIFPLLEILQEKDLIVSIHCEEPTAPALERERAYHETFLTIHRNFPRLRMIFEHVSNKESAELVERLPEHIAASITIHHLLLTLEDILGGPLNSYAFCRPLVKSEADRTALLTMALSGNPKFFFGSDSAPHSLAAKQAGAAGIFSSPVAIPLLIQIFEEAAMLDRLEAFVSRFGADFYRLPHNSESVVYEKQDFLVPEQIGEAKPLFAGSTLAWKLASLA